MFPIDSIDQLLDHDQQRSNIFVQGNVSLENSIVPNSIIIDSKYKKPKQNIISGKYIN